MNDEQREVEEAIARAIIASLTLDGTWEPEDYLGPWVVVASIERLTGGDAAPYFMAYSGEHQPPHITYGLLAIGADITRSWNEGDDDD